MSIPVIPLTWQCDKHGAVGVGQGCYDCALERVAALEAEVADVHSRAIYWVEAILSDLPDCPYDAQEMAHTAIRRLRGEEPDA